MKSIYLDHASTTLVDPRVFDAMRPYFEETFANPSSLHAPGQTARKAVDRARATLAALWKVSPREVVFTAGGTESDNLALFGVMEANAARGNHLIVSAVEHEAVMESAARLEQKGTRVTRLPVDRDGTVKLDELKAALTPQTVLISLMAANNEVGTIQPVEAIAALLQAYKKELGRPSDAPPFFHSDACQAAGTSLLHPWDAGLDLMTVNAGKLYGPKGVGALVVRQGVPLAPQIVGGGQEGGRRSGTENVPGIVGFAAAVEIAHNEHEHENARLTALRDTFIRTLESSIPDTTLHGSRTQRLPNNIHVTFRGVPGEVLLLRLDGEGIFASAGSACTAGSAEPSHVLRAMGVSKEEAYNAVRFSLGRSTTAQDLEEVAQKLIAIVADIRTESGLY